VIAVPSFSVESFGDLSRPFRQAPAPLNLHAGQVVQGRVLKSLSSGIFLVSISGKQIRVASDIPLPKNTLLTVMVSGEKGRAPSFRVMDIQVPGTYSVNPAPIRSALAQNLWGDLAALAAKGSDLSGDRSRLIALLRQVTRAVVDQPGLLGVKSFVRDAGFSFENKLFQAISSGKATPASLENLLNGDVKGLISKILADAKESATALKGLYNALEHIQLLNLHSGQETGKLFVPIPLQFQDGTWGLAQILFYLPSYYEQERPCQKNDSEKKKVCSVTLVITLSRLGTIRADLKLKEMTLQGGLQVDRPDTLEKIEPQLPLLTRMLESRGIDVDAFFCRLVKPSDLKADLISEIVSQEGSSVCFVA
jgi:hypothetical protein